MISIVRPSITVGLPGVHLAGSDAHHDAHFEVGPHGVALFLSPEAVTPFLDINGTPDQLDAVVRDLRAALSVIRAAGAADTLSQVRSPRPATTDAR
jgi:hypothetical protein